MAIMSHMLIGGTQYILAFLKQIVHSLIVTVQPKKVDPTVSPLLKHKTHLLGLRAL